MNNINSNTAGGQGREILPDMSFEQTKINFGVGVEFAKQRALGAADPSRRKELTEYMIETLQWHLNKLRAYEDDEM